MKVTFAEKEPVNVPWSVVDSSTPGQQMVAIVPGAALEDDEDENELDADALEDEDDALDEDEDDALDDEAAKDAGATEVVDLALLGDDEDGELDEDALEGLETLLDELRTLPEDKDGLTAGEGDDAAGGLLGAKDATRLETAELAVGEAGEIALLGIGDELDGGELGSEGLDELREDDKDGGDREETDGNWPLPTQQANVTA
jgi:hypothetical protein